MLNQLFAALCVAATLILLQATTTGHAEILSAGVGTVRGELLTSRQVQIANMIEKVLFAPNEKPVLLGLDSNPFTHATQATLLEIALALESQSFSAVQVQEDDVVRSQRSVSKGLQNNWAWKELRVSDKELLFAIRRKLKARKFVQFRTDSSALPVSEAEAQKYFEENRGKFEGTSFENQREFIRSYLSRSQVDRRLSDWYDVLRTKYQVKSLLAEL